MILLPTGCNVYVTPAAATISAGNSRRRIERQAVVPALKTLEESKRPQASFPQDAVPGTHFQRKPLHPIVAKAKPRAIRTQQLAAPTDVQKSCHPSRLDSDGIKPCKVFAFEAQTPDSLFSSQNDPILPTTGLEADARAVSYLK